MPKPPETAIEELFATQSGVSGLWGTTGNVDTDEQSDLNKAFARCFNSNAGRKVLTYLMSYRGAAGFNAQLGLFNGIANGFAHEGQMALLAEIENRILAGRK